MSEGKGKVTPIKPIVLNGQKINYYIVEPSALKHFMKESFKIFPYICKSLDGQNRESFELGKDGKPRYHIYSQLTISSVISEKIKEKHRDTCYYIEGESIVFYHCSPRRPGEYEKAPSAVKIRQQ